MPNRQIQAGEVAFARGVVLEACSDAMQMRFESPHMAITIWVPSTEVAKAADIGQLRPMPLTDLEIERAELEALRAVNSPATTLA